MGGRVRVHEDSAKELLRSLLMSEDGALAVRAHLLGIATGRWSQAYLDAIGQYHRHSPARWPLEQVAAFILVNHMKMTGALGEAEVVVGSQPSADRDRAINGSALAALPPPFRASVDLAQISSEAGDGHVEWSESIVVQRSLGIPLIDSATGHRVPLVVREQAAPGLLPLEIGTTTPSKTLEHLTKGTGVVRWPYRSNRLRLLVRVREQTA